MQLSVRDLTSESFSAYGAVIEKPMAVPEASGPGWQWWSEVAMIPQGNEPFSVGYLDLEPQPLEFDCAEYHLESQEVIIPLNHECLVYVGPPGRAPEWKQFEVFRVRPGQGVVLSEGVWHGAPLAVDQPLNALVLLRQGTGANDVIKSTRSEGPVLVAAES